MNMKVANVDFLDDVIFPALEDAIPEIIEILKEGEKEYYEDLRAFFDNLGD